MGGIFPACRYRGIRGCPLTSVKRNAFYESGKNCTQGFGTGWGGSQRAWGTDTETGRDGEKVVSHLGEGERNFDVTGVVTKNPATDISWSGFSL